MSERDDAMQRRVDAQRERLELEEAIHVEGRGGGSVGNFARKFDSRLHPHDRVGKFAQTFTEHPHFAHNVPVAGSPGRGPGDVPKAGKAPRVARDAHGNIIPADEARRAARGDTSGPEHEKPKAPRRAPVAPAPRVTRDAQGNITPADEQRRAARGDTSGPESKRPVERRAPAPRAPRLKKNAAGEYVPAEERRRVERGIPAPVEHAPVTPARRAEIMRGIGATEVGTQTSPPGAVGRMPPLAPMHDEPIVPPVLPGDDTQSQHSNQNTETGGRDYSPERKALHDQIVQHFLKGKRKVSGQKRALFLAGGPASGKSTALALKETQALQPKGAVHIDPDAIKTMIPEYQSAVARGDVRAASLVHEESSDISKRLLSEAMARGHHILRDGTGDSGTDKLAKQIQQMREAGYAADALYVNAPTDVAVPRAHSRAQRTGRFVPEAEIRRQHSGVSRAFEATVRGLAESGAIGRLQMYHTHDDKSMAPTLFASASDPQARGPRGSSASPGSRFQVHHIGLYDAFIRKGMEGVEPGVAHRHVAEAEFSPEERKKLAKKGHAMPDGSYPIRNGGDLDNAVQAIGRAPNRAAVKAHIVKRAKALGMESKLPDGWIREASMLRRVEERMLEEAADSLAKASTPEPFSKSKTSNWVARGGGLPDYIQHIAHDLVEKRGMDESKAIGMAIGIVRRWARGGGKVDAGTRAAAALAIAQWEKLKADNAAKHAA